MIHNHDLCPASLYTMICMVRVQLMTWLDFYSSVTHWRLYWLGTVHHLSLSWLPLSWLWLIVYCLDHLNDNDDVVVIILCDSELRTMARWEDRKARGFFVDLPGLQSPNVVWWAKMDWWKWCWLWGLRTWPCLLLAVSWIDQRCWHDQHGLVASLARGSLLQTSRQLSARFCGQSIWVFLKMGYTLRMPLRSCFTNCQTLCSLAGLYLHYIPMRFPLYALYYYLLM